MAKRSPVTDQDIQAIIRAEIASADGQANSELSIERGLNMDYYQGRAFGNEIDGRSSVVSTDVSDTIEWMLPTLIRIFCSGEDAVEFEPETEKDAAAAKQATEYVNFIWNRDNPGFKNFYSWFKDALLSKNGVIKIWWDDTPKTKRESYKGLDDTAFAYLVNDDDVKVSEHTEYTDECEIVVPDPQTGQLVPQKQEYTLHDLVITRTISKGCVKVVPVPPEEFLISNDARSIEHARFVGHRRRRTVSELIQEGYKRDRVEALSGDETSIQTDAEEIKRNTVEFVVPLSEATINPSMRKLWVVEGYLLADVDGDGIAEMRKVVAAGAGWEVLSNEPWDTPRPFADLTPILMPHRYHGRAVADTIRDIQLIKSTILRQYLDNLYLANNQREQVIEANIVDPSEVLSSAPGRKIRIKNGEAIFPIMVPNISANALEGMQYLDQMRENRTGVSPRTQGLGANDLHDTASGERMLMSMAMGKVELIARTFAETGVKDAFRLILKLVCKYQDKPRTIRLTKDNWVPMDPSQWNSDMDMTVRVGMGMGDKDQQLQHATLLGQMQGQAIPLGFVSAENLRNNAEDFINAMGRKGVDRYFTFPQGPQAMQPVQIPGQGAGGQAEMAKVQGQIQVEHVKAQGQMQVAQTKAQGQIAVAQQKAHAQAQSDAQANSHSAALQMFQAQQKANLEAYVAQQELALKNKQLEMNHIIDANNAATAQSMKSEAV